MKENYRLKEYMASSQEELLRRNLAQVGIWNELIKIGKVEKTDMPNLMMCCLLIFN
jgi:hypothetical protein